MELEFFVLRHSFRKICAGVFFKSELAIFYRSSVWVPAVEAGHWPNIDGQYFLLLCLNIPVPSHISYFDLVCANSGCSHTPELSCSEKVFPPYLNHSSAILEMWYGIIQTVTFSSISAVQSRKLTSMSRSVILFSGAEWPKATAVLYRKYLPVLAHLVEPRGGRQSVFYNWVKTQSLGSPYRQGCKSSNSIVPLRLG